MNREFDWYSLYDAIAHGDEEHRRWLKEAIEAHINGRQVPPPYGKGTKEILLQRIQSLEDELALCRSELPRKVVSKPGAHIEVSEGKIPDVIQKAISANLKRANETEQDILQWKKELRRKGRRQAWAKVLSGVRWFSLLSLGVLIALLLGGLLFLLGTP